MSETKKKEMDEKERVLYDFEQFAVSVNKSWASMMEHHILPTGTMRRLWMTCRKEEWFLDALYTLRIETIDKLEYRMRKTLGPFLDLERYFADQRSLQYTSYDSWYDCFCYYQKLIRHPDTIPLPLAEAINLRFCKGFQKNHDKKSSDSSSLIKQQAALLLQQEVIPAFYKYYMFTWDDYIRGRYTLQEEEGNFIDLSVLMAYRPVHPLLLQRDFIDCYRFSCLMEPSSTLLDYGVFNEKQIQQIAGGVGYLRVDTFRKEQPVWQIVSTIRNPQWLGQQIQLFPGAESDSRDTVSLTQLLENIPQMKGSTIRQIKNQIDFSPYIVPLPIRIFPCAKDKRDYVYKIHQKVDAIDKAKTRERVFGLIRKNRAIEIADYYTYEELIWYQLLPSMADKKVCAWLQSDNQTRRRLLENDRV